MHELLIYNVGDDLVGVYTHGDGSLKSISRDELMWYENANTKEVERVIGDIVKYPKLISNVKLTFDNSVSFNCGHLKITLKDANYFKNDERFSCVFKKLNKQQFRTFELIKNNIIKGTAVGLASVIALATASHITAPLIDKKNDASSYSSTIEDENGFSFDIEEDNPVKNVSYDYIDDAEEKEVIEEKVEIKQKEEVEETTFASEYKDRLDIGERAQTTKAQDTRDLYFDIIEKYANMYGLDPYVIEAIATQERGVHSSSVDSGGAIGLMQVQVAVWDGSTISAYNYENEKQETIHITLDNLRDVNFNIKVGCAIFQNYLKYMDGNVCLAIQCYNMGPGTMNSIMQKYAYEKGISVSDVKKNTDDLGWMKYVTSEYPGDPGYLNHVVSYYKVSPDTMSKKGK